MLKCVIVGCKSSTDTGIRFIKFPKSDSLVYNIWKDVCSMSMDIIRIHPDPHICAKHFATNCDLIRENSIPSLYLNPTHELAKQTNAILTAKLKRTYLLDLVETAVLEWSMRAYHYPTLAPVRQLRSTITPIARKVLNMVGPELEFSFDDSWWTKFRTMQGLHLKLFHINHSLKNTLDLVEIIHELDPTIEIKSELVLGGKAESDDTGSLKSVEDVKSSDIEDCSKFVMDDNVKNLETNVNDKVQEDISCESNIKPELTIDSYTHALEYIKTLEDFALEQEDYRAIGMLSNLKYILQNDEDLQ